MGLGTAIDFPRSIGLCYITKSSLLEGRQGDTGEIIRRCFSFGVGSSNETGRYHRRRQGVIGPGPSRRRTENQVHAVKTQRRGD